MNYLGIEIGGTKLQLGVGAGDGVLAGLWRGTVIPANGPDGIRRQIIEAVPIALDLADVSRGQLHGVGIGGGPILDGKIYRGVGRGAAEFGHLRTWHNGQYVTLESIASGWGMEQRAAEKGRRLTVPQIAEEALRGDAVAGPIFSAALAGLAEAICHVIALLCPRRIV